MNLALQDIRNKKYKLQVSIKELIETFEKETDTRVAAIKWDPLKENNKNLSTVIVTVEVDL